MSEISTKHTQKHNMILSPQKSIVNCFLTFFIKFLNFLLVQNHLIRPHCCNKVIQTITNCYVRSVLHEFGRCHILATTDFYCLHKTMLSVHNQHFILVFYNGSNIFSITSGPYNCIPDCIVFYCIVFWPQFIESSPSLL